MKQSGAVTKISLAVLGSWLFVMPAAVLTIALRLRAFDPSGLPTEYSLTLAAGWLTMIAGLIGFGHVSDALERTGHARVTLVRIAIPLLALTGLGLAAAPSPWMLAAVWVLAQLPAAAIVTSALAMSGTSIRPDRRGALSGLIGAASTIALLIGSVIVRSLQSNLAFAFIATSLIGAALTLPLALSPPASSVEPVITDRRARPTARVTWASAWGVFTVASLFLSWATSTANSYVVLFVEHLGNAAASEVANTSTRAVMFATLSAIIASLISGASLRGRRSAAWIWSGSAVVVALGLLGLLALPTTAGILVFATLFGAAFGSANGVELGLLLSVRHNPHQLGRDLGIFNAMTSVPYVLVPATATAWFAGNVASGIRGMFITASVIALVGAGMTAGVAVTSRRRS